MAKNRIFLAFLLFDIFVIFDYDANVKFFKKCEITPKRSAVGNTKITLLFWG